ncbi:MAG: hypothetical protein ACO1SV_19680 [Fimbriimonas sp.]
MIWRPSRPSRVLHAVRLPYEGPDGILVGAFDVAALRELGVWRRLVRTSLPQHPLHTLLIAEAWTPRARRTAEAGFPPSEAATLDFVSDPEGKWSLALGRQPEEATFVALVRNGGVPLAIVGGAADEAWDQLEAAAG